ncbi:3'-5'-exoribonuclease [Knufia obscura]|uniref:Exosome complex component RRP45 n=2 Tax=Knufia TaxID=430999 RepID=A0AAN8IJ88_9EURO|nr:3'-5'-exoribonuclease [Knufia obscura]KAK5949912.1 3'-5'-exoribonuclease [Knufia fluminis]
MPRAIDISNVEKTFILEALATSHLRLDGRPSDQFRDVTLSFGAQLGTVTISIGKTRVNVQISAEVTKPSEERKFDGIFTVTTELSPIASPAFEIGRPNEQEVILSRILEKAIRRSRAIDTESLCIVAGQKCWSVRADVHVLDFDGGLIDACCMATMAALYHFRRPDVSVDGERVTIHTMAERVPVPLSILHSPICVTFSFFGDGSVTLLDATAKEEQVREAELIITANDFEVCQVAKHGGRSIDPALVMKSFQVAVGKAREMNKLIRMRLAEDASARGVQELSAENDRGEPPVG